MRLFTFLCLIGVGLLTPINKGAADSNDHSRSDNLSALSAEWWQWALSIPTSFNPLLDTTGNNCMVGQHGPVWFLAGFFFGGAGTRDCTVPDDKFIFFPVANSINFNTPDVCDQVGDLSVRDLRQASKTFFAGVTAASAELDQRPIKLLRHIRSDVFGVALPEENIFDSACTALGGLPAGVYSPSVDGGLYVLLHPLDEGQHTLRFHSENPTQGFTEDVTYILKVKHVAVRQHPDKDQNDDRHDDYGR